MYVQTLATTTMHQETFQDVITQADQSFNSILGLLALPEYSGNIDTALVWTGPFLKMFSIVMGIFSILAIALFVAVVFRDIFAILLHNLGIKSTDSWYSPRPDAEGNPITSIAGYFKAFMGRLILSIIVLGLFASNQLFPIVAKGMLLANHGLKTVYAFDTTMSETEARHMLSAAVKEKNGQFYVDDSTRELVKLRYSPSNGDKEFSVLLTEIVVSAQAHQEETVEEDSDEQDSETEEDGEDKGNGE